MIGAVLGGVGLFLLGMALLTDGLQSVAGDSLRAVLRRWTRTPLAGVAAGAVVTAVVQSSSATTLAVIGFVGAGVIPFASALGVVFGANVGTTATAWIVATLGLEVKVSAFALPLVGLGALVRVFTRGRRAALASAVAGFGLVFVGIDVMQTGMQSIAIEPTEYAREGVAGSIALVLIGAAMTVVLQSSSAAVAATLAALGAEAIRLDQAAALVIGQNVGTTVTAGVAAIGGSAAVKRVALAHVLFNVVTGIVALAMLPFFTGLVTRLATGSPAMALAAFHSAFNLLGVLMFAPLTPAFARWLESRIPEEGAELTRRLATGFTAMPQAVIEAARLTARAIAAEAAHATRACLSRPLDEDELVDRLGTIRAALDATRERLRAIRSDPESTATYRTHVSTLHAVDHLYRLVEALAEQVHWRVWTEHVAPRAAVESVRDHLDGVVADLERPEEDAVSTSASEAAEVSRATGAARRANRPWLLERAARGDLDPVTAEAELDAMRWIDRIAYHLWRTLHHLEAAEHEVPLAEPPAPASEGRRADETYETLD